jgi:hypothetical protein
MPTLILYRYRVFDPIRRRWAITPAMTEEEAVRLASAVRLDWSREERHIPEDRQAMSTSAFLSRPGSIAPSVGARLGTSASAK